MGKKKVPDAAYYGVQTVRALENFPVSGRRERPELVRAYAMIKFAAARTNVKLGTLEAEGQGDREGGEEDNGRRVSPISSRSTFSRPEPGPRST